MGLLENQTIDVTSSAAKGLQDNTYSVNIAMDKYSMFAAQNLLQELHLRKEEKEKMFVETSNKIKCATKKIITEIKLQEEQLLNELWHKNQKELSQLQKCYSDLKRKLTEIIKMHQNIKRRSLDISLTELNGCSKMQTELQKTIEKEIENLSKDGKSVLKSTENILNFKQEDSTYNIGILTEDQPEAINDTVSLISSPIRKRSNTLSISFPEVKSGKSTLRKAHSTNDLFISVQEMSLVFQMSNDDLFLSNDDLHTDLNPYINFVINKHGKGLGELQSPRDAIFLPSGNLLVAEHGNKRLQLFDPETGKALKLLQSVELKPCGISLTKDGYIVVADQMNNTIKALTRSGEMVCQFGTGYFKDISFIAAESNESYIVIDNMGAWQQCAFMYNCMSGVKTRIGYNTNKMYVINHPEYICLDDKNNIIITDGGNHCVWVFDQKGKLKFNFGQQGEKPGELCYPKGICLTSKGHFIVADCGNHRICQFDNRGNYLKCLLTKEDGINYPQVVQLKEAYLVIVQSSGIIGCKL